MPLRLSERFALGVEIMVRCAVIGVERGVIRRGSPAVDSEVATRPVGRQEELGAHIATALAEQGYPCTIRTIQALKRWFRACADGELPNGHVHRRMSQLTR